MKRINIKQIRLLSPLVLATFFVACGGGGSTTATTSSTPTTSNPVTSSSVKISGTVPGTLVEAFCDDGSYKQVTSTNNGTNEHPFSISVPSSRNCNLVMTMYENNGSKRIINNIGFDNGTQQGTALKTDKDINLGNVALPTTYGTGIDSNGDHVNDNRLYVSTTGVTVASQIVQDSDNNGKLDAYDDKDGNGVVNAYEDDNANGTPNIHEDVNNDGKPDYIEDDNRNGTINFLEDNNGNGRADYAETNSQGVENHLDQNGNGVDDRNEANSNEANG